MLFKCSFCTSICAVILVVVFVLDIAPPVKGSKTDLTKESKNKNQQHSATSEVEPFLASGAQSTLSNDHDDSSSTSENPLGRLFTDHADVGDMIMNYVCARPTDRINARLTNVAMYNLAGDRRPSQYAGVKSQFDEEYRQIISPSSTLTDQECTDALIKLLISINNVLPTGYQAANFAFHICSQQEFNIMMRILTIYASSNDPEELKN